MSLLYPTKTSQKLDIKTIFIPDICNIINFYCGEIDKTIFVDTCDNLPKDPQYAPKVFKDGLLPEIYEYITGINHEYPIDLLKVYTHILHPYVKRQVNIVKLKHPDVMMFNANYASVNIRYHNNVDITVLPNETIEISGQEYSLHSVETLLPRMNNALLESINKISLIVNMMNQIHFEYQLIFKEEFIKMLEKNHM